MLFFSLFIGAILILAGLLTYVFAPRVGPNPIFGVRVGYAFASREIWDQTNRFGGILLAFVGAGVGALGGVLQLLNVTGQGGTVIVTLALIVATLGATAWMFVYARRLAQGTPMAHTLAPVRFRWSFLAPVGVTFGLLVAEAAYWYPQLPALRVATHFNFAEQADGWQSRDQFLVMYLGIAALFVGLDALAVFVATREPLIAFGRWGDSWRLDPERGLVFTGMALALTNLILIAVLWDIGWFNTRGVHAFPLALILVAIVPLVIILIGLFFLLGRKQV